MDNQFNSEPELDYKALCEELAAEIRALKNEVLILECVLARLVEPDVTSFKNNRKRDIV